MYLDLNKLVKFIQTHQHRKRCEKTKTPWPPSDKTFKGENFSEEKQEESKAILDQILVPLGRLHLFELTLQNILDEFGITKDQYDNALEFRDNRVSIVCKTKLNEWYIRPYNTVIQSLVKSNMNLQFVTDIYRMILYLTKYLIEVENRMSELMKKVSKEAANQDIRAKLREIGNAFLTIVRTPL